MNGCRHVGIIVVVHGASELILCESIRANLRLPIEIISKNKGSNSIQINKLETFFLEKNFNKYIFNQSKFQTENGKLVNTKIFTIMDTDDCNCDTLGRYKCGSIFSRSPYFNMISPIFNSPDLDSVMEELGYYIDKDQKRKSYGKIFPGENGDIKAAETLRDQVSDLSSTNLGIFLDHCIKESRKNSFNNWR